MLSPPNEPVSVYVAAGSPGVMEHEAVPVASVVPVQVSVPLSTNVTGSFGTGAFVYASVSTPDTVVASEKSLVPGLTVSVVGSVTVAGVFTVIGVS